jgi:hypothetical protein
VFSAYRETVLDFAADGEGPGDAPDAGIEAILGRILGGLGKLMGLSAAPAAAVSEPAPAPVAELASEPAAEPAPAALDLAALAPVLANPAVLTLAARGLDLAERAFARVEAAPAPRPPPMKWPI